MFLYFCFIAILASPNFPNFRCLMTHPFSFVCIQPMFGVVFTFCAMLDLVFYFQGSGFHLKISWRHRHKKISSPMLLRLHLPTFVLRTYKHQRLGISSRMPTSTPSCKQTTLRVPKDALLLPAAANKVTNAARFFRNRCPGHRSWISHRHRLPLMLLYHPHYYTSSHSLVAPGYEQYCLTDSSICIGTMSLKWHLCSLMWLPQHQFPNTKLPTLYQNDGASVVLFHSDIPRS